MPLRIVYYAKDDGIGSISVNLWGFTDEHPDSINDGWLVVDPTSDDKGSRDLPGSYPDRANSMHSRKGIRNTSMVGRDNSPAVTQVMHLAILDLPVDR